VAGIIMGRAEKLFSLQGYAFSAETVWNQPARVYSPVI
jgi:hypothetical protein